MEAACVARSLLWDAEYTMMFKSSVFHMLMQNYRAMTKQSETKVKKELTHQEWP
jgi:hypothetical protein